MLLRKAFLALLIDLCEKERYSDDIELFLTFLTLTKSILKDSKLSHESSKCKDNIYSFIFEHCLLLLKKVISLICYLLN